VVKNKVAPPFRRAEFDILYTEGISTSGDLIDLGLEYGFVTKAGAWFSYKHPNKEAIRLGQGRESVRTILNENPELAAELDSLIREMLNPVKVEAPKSSGDVPEKPAKQPAASKAKAASN